MLRPPLPLAAALAVALGALPAAAAPPAALGWVRLPGAEACIGTRDLALEVEQRLGRAAFVPPAQAEVIVEGRVEAAPAGFRAHLVLTDVRGAVLGTRDLDAPPSGGCRALDEQLGLVIALLIDPDATLAPRGAAPAPAPPPPPPPRVERAAVPVPAPAPPAREPWRESLSVGAAVAAGLLPRAGVALALRGEIVPPSFVPLEIGGAVWLDARAEAPGDASKGATLSLAYGMVGICPLAWGPGSTRVRGCAEVGVGAIRGIGYGFTASQGAGDEQVVAHGALAGRVAQRIWGPLEVGLGLDLLVPFRRARFFYVDAAGGQQEIFRTAPVAGVVEGSVGVAFP